MKTVQTGLVILAPAKIKVKMTKTVKKSLYWRDEVHILNLFIVLHANAKDQLNKSLQQKIQISLSLQTYF